MNKQLTGIIILIVIAAVFLIFSGGDSNQGEELTMKNANPIVTLKTSEGDIKLELFLEESPITAGNFLKLAEEGFFDGIKFHRVIDGFMIQSGDPNSKNENTPENAWGTGGPGYAIEDEFIEGLSNVAGTISMANSGPNSGGSQFFINLIDNTNLDFDKGDERSKHPVFGKVIEGIEVVIAIGSAQTDQRDVPLEAIIIESIAIETADDSVMEEDGEKEGDDAMTEDEKEK